MADLDIDALLALAVDLSVDAESPGAAAAATPERGGDDADGGDGDDAPRCGEGHRDAMRLAEGPWVGPYEAGWHCDRCATQATGSFEERRSCSTCQSDLCCDCAPRPGADVPPSPKFGAFGLPRTHYAAGSRALLQKPKPKPRQKKSYLNSRPPEPGAAPVRFTEPAPDPVLVGFKPVFTAPVAPQSDPAAAEPEPEPEQERLTPHQTALQMAEQMATSRFAHGAPPDLAAWAAVAQRNLRQLRQPQAAASQQQQQQQQQHANTLITIGLGIPTDIASAGSSPADEAAVAPAPAARRPAFTAPEPEPEPEPKATPEPARQPAKRSAAPVIRVVASSGGGPAVCAAPATQTEGTAAAEAPIGSRNSQRRAKRARQKVQQEQEDEEAQVYTGGGGGGGATLRIDKDAANRMIIRSRTAPAPGSAGAAAAEQQQPKSDDKISNNTKKTKQWKASTTAAVPAPRPRCAVCEKDFDSLRQMEEHLAGQKHLKKLRKMNERDTNTKAAAKSNAVGRSKPQAAPVAAPVAAPKQAAAKPEAEAKTTAAAALRILVTLVVPEVQVKGEDDAAAAARRDANRKKKDRKKASRAKNAKAAEPPTDMPAPTPTIENSSRYGLFPNLAWRAVTIDQLRHQHHCFLPLPPTGRPGSGRGGRGGPPFQGGHLLHFAPDQPSTWRLLRQESPLWQRLHSGILTSRNMPDFLGLHEPKAVALLDLPRNSASHAGMVSAIRDLRAAREWYEEQVKTTIKGSPPLVAAHGMASAVFCELQMEHPASPPPIGPGLDAAAVAAANTAECIGFARGNIPEAGADMEGMARWEGAKNAGISRLRMAWGNAHEATALAAYLTHSNSMAESAKRGGSITLLQETGLWMLDVHSLPRSILTKCPELTEPEQLLPPIGASPDAMKTESTLFCRPIPGLLLTDAIVCALCLQCRHRLLRPGSSVMNVLPYDRDLLSTRRPR